MSAKQLLGMSVVLLLAAGLVLYGLHGGRQGTSPAAEAARPGDPLAAYRGKALLLVLGMPGCSGTERITSFFTEYAAQKPAQVELLRVDVPPPGEHLDAQAPWSAPFKRQVDSRREIAKALDFFSYPTLYALDRDGAIRFKGPCDPAQVKTMMAELVVEPPGTAKRLYSPPMPDIGAAAGDFTASTLGGKEVSLSALLGQRATLLFFGSTTCPFSQQALPSLPRLARAYGSKGAAIVIVNQGASAEAIREAYAGLELPVVVDADNSISLGRYGVWAVPFFYVLDAKGKVLARQAYSEDAGKGALAQALGLTSPGVVLPQAGAG